MSNLTLRTITGAVFLVVMVAGIIIDPIVLGVLFLLVMTVALREFYEISLGQQLTWQKRLAILAGWIFFITVLFSRIGTIDTKWILAGLIPLILMPIVSIFESDHTNFGSISLLYTGLLYIAAPICLIPLLVIKGNTFDGTLLLSLFILIWVSDIGAYCFGTAFGQKENSKKLAPAISPKKSWWGFWGAVVLGTAAAIGLHFLTWLPFSVLHSAVVGVIVSVFAVCGDLVESLWKRYYHVKDSGNCIPGHGGMLDRFDSSLIAIPMAAIYMALFNLI